MFHNEVVAIGRERRGNEEPIVTGQGLGGEVHTLHVEIVFAHLGDARNILTKNDILQFYF